MRGLIDPQPLAAHQRNVESEVSHGSMSSDTGPPQINRVKVKKNARGPREPRQTRRLPGFATVHLSPATAPNNRYNHAVADMQCSSSFARNRRPVQLHEFVQDIALTLQAKAPTIALYAPLTGDTCS